MYFKSILVFFDIVNDFVSFIHFTSVKDSENVLSRSVNIASKQKTGKTVQVVVLIQLVLIAGSQSAISFGCDFRQRIAINSNHILVKILQIPSPSRSIVSKNK